MIFLTVTGDLRRTAAGENAADFGFDVLSRKWDPVPKIEGAAGSGVRQASSRRVLPNRFKDHARRLGRLIPMREVAAALGPVQRGRRECYLGACGLARQQQVVLAAPANGDEAGGRCRTLLQRPACQL